MSSSIRFNNENVETIPEITLRDAVKLTFTDVADTEMGIQAWAWEISPPQGNKSRHAEFEENFQFAAYFWSPVLLIDNYILQSHN